MAVRLNESFEGPDLDIGNAGLNPAQIRQEQQSIRR
jgi:hypothetical protein